MSVRRILRNGGSAGLNETAEMTSRRPVRGARPIAGIGRVLLWPGGSLWVGRQAGPVAPHAHHALQISLALTGRVRLCSDPPGDWAEHAGVLVHVDETASPVSRMVECLGEVNDPGTSLKPGFFVVARR